MRIQKYLSQEGVCSRREAEKLIEEGKLYVNGKKAIPGLHVCEGDRIQYNGRVLIVKPSKKKLEVLRYYKPLGEVCSKNIQSFSATVFDRLPKNEPWFLVGRLDVNTTGLLLMTNSGDLAHQLMHAKFQHERIYEVKCSQQLSQKQIKQLCCGVQLEDGEAKFLSVESQKKYHYRVTLRQGRNRIVRRLIKAVGAHVAKLHRVQFAGIRLAYQQRPGEFRPLTEGALKRLLERIDYS